MSRTILMGLAAGLALAGSGPAWAEDARSDLKTPAGDVWFDEFYGASAASPTPAVAAAPSHRAASPGTAGQHAQKHAHRAVGARARAHQHRLARTW